MAQSPSLSTGDVISAPRSSRDEEARGPRVGRGLMRPTRSCQGSPTGRGCRTAPLLRPALARRRPVPGASGARKDGAGTRSRLGGRPCFLPEARLAPQSPRVRHLFLLVLGSLSLQPPKPLCQIRRVIQPNLFLQITGPQMVKREVHVNVWWGLDFLSPDPGPPRPPKEHPASPHGL